MSELKLISPMLDNFMVGDAINERDGLRTYPAMRQETDEKYIIKVISVPSSPEKLDALILSGAYKDRESALIYFRERANEIAAEIATLNQLSALEGFLAFEDCQTVENEDGTGYAVYLLSPYKRSLEKHLLNIPMTHLAAANLGLDLCAALTVARRSGYLYADLRPDNVYVTPEGEYKIGDIGFIRMDGLKYATLPDRYRSAYTAPEAVDPYAAPSDTMDVYALGLILYQVYNNNLLPTAVESSEPFAAPQYADYEMSEIILKACAPNPKDRWSSPVEMGQAIVSYMQRNGIEDLPIIPIPVTEEVSETAGETEVIEAPDTASEDNAVPSVTTETESDEAQVVYAEDDFGNLAFLEDAFTDSDMLSEDLDNYAEVSVSGEVTEILEQAEDLAAHTVPEPVVAPDAIEVPIPVPEEEPVNTEETQAVAIPDEVVTEQPAEEKVEVVEEAPQTTEKKKKRTWLRTSLIILAILSILAVGVYCFMGYYFVPIDNLWVEYSKDAPDTLYVHVQSKIDESLLIVECSYPEGTPLTSEVKNGVATFTGLTDNTGYSIKVRIKGFHRLTGESTTACSTPQLTTLSYFTATTGSTDGSMTLTFLTEGKEPENGWTLTYWADGEPQESIPLPKNSITLEGLTIGKTYTFRLDPVTGQNDDSLYLVGDWMIQATASKLLYAENIAITEFSGNKLSAEWTAPEGADISSWTVHCYNDQGYQHTQVVQEPKITLEGIDNTVNHTLEIVAQGMTVPARFYAYADSINISDFQAVPQANGSLQLSWTSDEALPEGTFITYTVDGYPVPQQYVVENNTAIIPSYIPGAKHLFKLNTTTDDHFVGQLMLFNAEDKVPFSCTYYGYTVTADDMIFKMCRTPAYNNWNVYYVPAEDYTTAFTAGDKASFVIQLTKVPGYSYDTIAVQYVIRDKNGKIVDISSVSFHWSYIWVDYHGALDIPGIPTESGNYTVDVFFNSAWVATQEFNIT